MTTNSTITLSDTIETESRTNDTFRREIGRALGTGILESGTTTFLLLIAVRFLDASAVQKSLLASAVFIGYLISPLTTSLSSRFSGSASTSTAVLYLLAALALIPATLTDNAWVFAVSATISAALANSVLALLTTIYQDNFPPTSRGRLLSKIIMVRIVTVALFSWLGGYLVAVENVGPHLLLGTILAAIFFASFCVYGCPSRNMLGAPKALSKSTLLEIWHDRLFRNTMTCWMVMGFGNLMMVSLRVEYLANPAHGVFLETAQVAIFTGVIPNLARFCFSSLWGRLFDRVNFFILRMTLNATFALAALAFFTSTTPIGLTIGALIFGAANAGGDIAWSLWITKFAPSERVAGYMAFHIFLTGIRGVLSPILAFYLLSRFPIGNIVWFASGLILLANLWLLPELLDSKSKGLQPLT